MAKPKPDSMILHAEALSVPERILLFCVASKTEWERAGITGATVTAMVVKGLIQHKGRCTPLRIHQLGTMPDHAVWHRRALRPKPVFAMGAV